MLDVGLLFMVLVGTAQIETATVNRAARTWVSVAWGIDMSKVYSISCRDAGVDCDFEAQGSSVDEVMQLCADHGAQEHNMRGFGPELFLKMRSIVKTLEEGTSAAAS